MVKVAAAEEQSLTSDSSRMVSQPASQLSKNSTTEQAIEANQCFTEIPMMLSLRRKKYVLPEIRN